MDKKKKSLLLRKKSRSKKFGKLMNDWKSIDKQAEKEKLDNYERMQKNIPSF